MCAALNKIKKNPASNTSYRESFKSKVEWYNIILTNLIQIPQEMELHLEEMTYF